MARRLHAAALLAGPWLLPGMVAKHRLISWAIREQHGEGKNSHQVWSGRGLIRKLCQLRRTVTGAGDFKVRT